MTRLWFTVCVTHAEGKKDQAASIRFIERRARTLTMHCGHSPDCTVRANDRPNLPIQWSEPPLNSRCAISGIATALVAHLLLLFKAACAFASKNAFKRFSILQSLVGSENTNFVFS